MVWLSEGAKFPVSLALIRSHSWHPKKVFFAIQSWRRIMNSKIMWHFFRQLRKVSVRVVGFALLAILTAIVSQTVAPLIPPSWTVKIGSNYVDQVLNILASSMLAVTTFSIAIATSAFSAAASSATPRATALLQEDSTAQNVLATFFGAFLFSLVGIVALQAGYYSNAGRLVLFIMTGAVLAAVIWRCFGGSAT